MPMYMPPKSHHTYLALYTGALDPRRCEQLRVPHGPEHHLRPVGERPVSVPGLPMGHR